MKRKITDFLITHLAPSTGPALHAHCTLPYSKKDQMQATRVIKWSEPNIPLNPIYVNIPFGVRLRSDCEWISDNPPTNLFPLPTSPQNIIITKSTNPP